MKTVNITLIITALTLLCFLSVSADDTENSHNAVLSGYIKDASNGETLIGATVFIRELNTGTITNVYGFYSLSVPPGVYQVQFSYVGYERIEQQLEINGKITYSPELSLNYVTLQEVVVSSGKANGNVANNQMSTIRLNTEDIKRMPAFMGEADVLKSIQLLPGVQNTAEGFSGFNVRGGSADQNLILLDEATVYNASHLMGFFSVFNSDAIKDVRIYKGDIPAQYGGRLSSLLDIRMKEGNSKKPQVTGGIGSIASRLTVETPLVQDRSSVLFSGRRTYVDLFLPLAKDTLLHNKLFFYDLNMKANYTVNDRNRIFLSGYFGRDVFSFRNMIDMNWGNSSLTYRWNHIFNEKLFSNFSFIYSDYNYYMGYKQGVSSFTWKSTITDAGGKADFSYYINPSNTLRFGLHSVYHRINPGKIRQESNGNIIEVPENRSLEHALYLSNDQKVSDRVLINYGLRWSVMQNIGKATVFEYDEKYEIIDTVLYAGSKPYHSYGGFEPRLGLSYIFNPSLSLKGSYSRTRQYLQLASNSSAGLPTDIWFPSSPNVKPQVSDQLAAGVFKNLFNDIVEFSVEGYYKKMYNQIDFRDNAEIFFNDKLEGEIRTGEAVSYGIEFLIRKQSGDMTGWIGYTLSTARRKIEEINNGDWYRSNYDKPHNLVIVVSYNITPRVNIGANWIYTSGAPITLPTGKWEYGNIIIPSYSGRNGYRLPDYHRLDLSSTIQLKRKKISRFQHELNVSCYNAYNRKNPFTIYFEPDKNDNNTMKAYKMSMFGIIPAVTWNFRF